MVPQKKAKPQPVSTTREGASAPVRGGAVSAQLKSIIEEAEEIVRAGAVRGASRTDRPQTGSGPRSSVSFGLD